jgi:hypothetical protein
VIEGRGPAPTLVLQLVQRLPDTSLTVALATGGRDHFGWGLDRHIAVDLFDALNANTRATGNWAKGKAPKIKPWPRPKRRAPKKETRGPVKLKDLFNRFQRR